MACITKEEKAAIIAKFARAEGDTGSTEVQIAILTAEINKLNDHMKQHPHDFHSQSRSDSRAIFSLGIGRTTARSTRTRSTLSAMRL